MIIIVSRLRRHSIQNSKTKSLKQKTQKDKNPLLPKK